VARPSQHLQLEVPSLNHPWFLWSLSFPAALILTVLASHSSGDEQKPVTVQSFVPPKGYVCYQTPSPLRIDGKLDEPAWQTAAWTDEFVDIEGGTKSKPRYRTRAKMLWDEQYFYVVAELEEPHVWATFTQHDSYIFQEDNDFEVFIDPDGDNHAYCEFEINALNTGWDLFLTMPYRDGGKALDSWNIPGLKTAVHINGTLNDPRDTDAGWTVELAFPWKVLGQLGKMPAPPKDGDQWRVNFSRVEWRREVVNGKYRRVPMTKEDNWVWSPQGAVNMHMPEWWGYVQFSTAQQGKAAFCPDPAGPVRYLLSRLYVAQHDYRKKQQRFARSLAELGVSKLTDPSLAGPIEVAATESLFEVTAPVRLPDGTMQRWHIRQDSKLWQD
jgi:hypothetical protein